jgi:hypothetical protein
MVVSIKISLLGCNTRVLQRKPNVLEEHIAFIFWVEEPLEQETRSRWQAQLAICSSETLGSPNYTALQPTRQFSLILYGIRMNCLSSRRRLLLYLITRLVIKLTVIILRRVTVIKFIQNCIQYYLLKVNFICQ